MSESDKKIKHFVIMRFFTFYDKKYPYDIYDVNFLRQQIILARNALGSLENQTNKNFELVFMVNDKFFVDSKYEFIFSSLKNSTSLPITFIKRNDIKLLTKDALNEYNYVITSRMDFDDFIYKDAIAIAQGKVDECDSILAHGYCKGYIYRQRASELYNFAHMCKGIGFVAILISLILKSSFAKNLPLINVYSFKHGSVKTRMERFLKKNNIVFSENMFQPDSSTRAFIYFRHEASHWASTRNKNDTQTEPINKVIKPGLTTSDITKKQLEEEFGFFHELNSIK